MNIAIALELLITLTLQIQKLASLINTARKTGEDIDISALAADDDIAKAILDAAIAKAKAEGRE